MILSKLDLPPKPGLEWEEYPLDPRSAAHMVYIAGWVNDDVGKRIVDLGCGSGILAISASLFRAEKVVIARGHLGSFNSKVFTSSSKVYGKYL